MGVFFFQKEESGRGRGRQMCCLFWARAVRPCDIRRLEREEMSLRMSDCWSICMCFWFSSFDFGVCGGKGRGGMRVVRLD